MNTVNATDGIAAPNPAPDEAAPAINMSEKKASINDRIKILRPDNSIIEAKIKGISFNLNRDILISGDLTKDDVPIGSEVWLNKE